MAEERISLKEYYDAILTEKDKALSAALRSNEKALEILAQNYKQDKDNQNEWRATVNDIISKTGGQRIGMKDMWGWIVGFVMFAIALAAFLLPHLK